MNPSALDVKGILMLNSVREIFDLVGIDFESMQFVSEKIEKKSIIDAINNQRKCPAIVAAMYDFSTRSFYNGHIMVAAGVKTETVQHGSSSKQEYFIQCKNSYRDDTNLSGKFHQRYRHRQ